MDKTILRAYITGFVFGFLFTFPISISMIEYIPPEQYITQEEQIRVGCGSDSMGLTLSCNDTLEVERFNKEKKPLLGRIYIFNRTNGTTVHRLIGCVDQDCNLTIFKGDNNYIGELIRKEDILWKVKGVFYE